MISSQIKSLQAASPFVKPHFFPAALILLKQYADLSVSFVVGRFEYEEQFPASTQAV